MYSQHNLGADKLKIMKIGLDLTWMSSENRSGGVHQYGMRLAQALTMYTNNVVVAIINEECDALFDHLRGYDNFRLVSKNHLSVLQGIIDREQIEVIHTPIQQHVNFTLAVPMINTLHDLQPFHFPEFFTQEEIEARDCYYRRSSEFSERVIVTFQHVKDDIVKFYDIPAKKIDVCFLGMPELRPVTTIQIEAVRRKYNLPENYLFYSANTWRHKNHIGLLKGMKLLHDKHGVLATLVCTGCQYPDFFPQIEDEIRTLGLMERVRFLGYLPEEDMLAILSGATLAVIPTLYEAGSYPLMEAMIQGVPVICSSTTSLPDTIGDPRFVFDPNSPDEMADKMALMLKDMQLCRENVANSSARVGEATWERGIKSFEESYRRAIADFEDKKKTRWFKDWVENYIFFENLQQHHQVDEVGRLHSCIGKLEGELHLSNELAGKMQSLVSMVYSSLSWRITKPLRWLGDRLRGINSKK